MSTPRGGPRREPLQNPGTGTAVRNRVMVYGFVIPFTAMSDLQLSARPTADPGTVRLALELLERTAGRRRRCRRCLVCRTDIAHLRAGARTCGDACRNMLSRLLRRQRRAVP